MLVSRPASSDLSVVSATCSELDGVGDVVYFSGSKYGANYVISKVDNKTGSKMPAVAVITSKTSIYKATIQFGGEISLYSDLMPGRRYFVGDNGRPSLVCPAPTYTGQKVYIQIMGLASGTNSLILDFSKTMYIRVG